MGAFVISAEQKEGKVIKVEILSEKGGVLRLAKPFNEEFSITGNQEKILENDEIIEINTTPGEKILLSAK